jgi:UDP-N-acetylglucosamine---dolichyl-phosphate N-acetylglucosaminyltransferase
MDIAIVIPVYNEADVIAEVINGIKDCGYHNLIVVDDGSADKTYLYAKATEKALVLRHRINRGKGAAVKTGVIAANFLGANIVVTMDGDGQHDPDDIITLIRPIIEEGYDVVLGSRMLHQKGMPLMKIVANMIGNLCTWVLYGIMVSDSQSGFRAYSKFAALIIDTKADKYEYDSKVIREIKSNRLKCKEVPVKTRYTDYSMGKKNKQGFVNGLKTLIRMLWKMVA